MISDQKWSPNYQPEIPTYTMILTRSGPDIRLSELGQQLEIAETRCDTLKSQLDYMKMLYQGDASNNSELKNNSNTSQIVIESSQKESALSAKTESQTTECDNSELDVTSKDIKYYSVLEEIHKIQQKSEEDTEIDDHCSVIKSGQESLLKDEDRLTQNMGMKSTCTIPGSTSFHLDTASVTCKEKKVHRKNNTNRSDDKKSLNEYATRIKENVIMQFKHSSKHSLINNINERIHHVPTAVRVNLKNQDLKLNISNSVENMYSSKCKTSTRKSAKQSTISSNPTYKNNLDCKIDQIIGSRFKKKRKLRCSNSKSTVTTKENVGKKYINKRKQKGQKAISSLPQPQTSSPILQQNWNGIVEIYHNNAIKSGSISVVSSKHSKFEPKIETPVKLLTTKNDQEIRVSPTHQYDKKKLLANNNVLFSQTGCRTVNQHIQRQSPNTKCIANYTYVPEKQYQDAAFNSLYYDPILIHNYELPTLASQLKRVNQPYFNRFNFRNIPFVVGTSITPSHNLGLNIQQVLSIMKSKQSTLSGITPLLIRKVSKGLKPVSALLEKISDNQEKTYDHKVLSSTIVEHLSVEMQQHMPKVLTTYPKTFNNNVLRNTCKEGNILPEVQWIKNHESVEKRPLRTVKQLTSQQTIKTYPKESNSLIEKSNTPKGIREVLINLHDQFEEMNKKYEKLQAKAEKSNNRSLTNEITVLEKELNVKEDEINVVVHLYKEVLSLKQQMKTLQEKNSFVCISTDIPVTNNIHSPRQAMIGRTCMVNPMQNLSMKRKNLANTMREPSTSVRLAALLRQIQAFQKQLKLSSQ